jgi:diaminohydroxyphosphoribosylaminopyrimidine deaminase / 5-amino-6-(5-phosphoribosylamino)uracil reductase
VVSLNAQEYMSQALALAAKGRGRTSPNPMVGAVVVSAGGEIVGQGFHERAGEAHAEVRALEMAGEKASGATLYCTLEPCSHTGRTGPCVVRIVDAGIAHVVASVEDPNPLVSGQGFEYLRAHGVVVDVGLGADASKALNDGFFTLMRERRPFVIMKAALSSDGCLAETPGVQTWFTSADADHHSHAVRAEVDAIAVGVGTVLIDDPLLTVRGAHRERPFTRVVFDRQLRTPPDARLLSTRDAGPVIIVTTATAAASDELRRPLEARGAEIEVASDATLRAALSRLGARQIETLLLEGGADVHLSAWDEGLVDFVRLYVTPHVVGAGGLKFLEGRGFDEKALYERHEEWLGPDLLIEGYVHRPR